MSVCKDNKLSLHNNHCFHTKFTVMHYIAYKAIIATLQEYSELRDVAKRISPLAKSPQFNRRGLEL